jgi:predicted small lipoprotein YifL
MKPLLALAIALALLVGCGKKGAPDPPGPQDKVTYPKAYPTH